MGNSESYKKVATTTDVDGSNNDLMFYFHASNQDSEDRAVRESYPDWTYQIFHDGQIIADRNTFADVLDNSVFFKDVQPGDAVEFVKPGKRFHWGIYIGNRKFVHTRNGEIVESNCESICKDRKARPVNNIYHIKPLPAVQIIRNAQEQIGKSRTWLNSECFVMWCRTGMSEFTMVQNLDLTPESIEGKYLLELQSIDGRYTQRFHTLAKLIQFRRNVEKFGKNEIKMFRNKS